MALFIKLLGVNHLYQVYVHNGDHGKYVGPETNTRKTAIEYMKKIATMSMGFYGRNVSAKWSSDDTVIIMRDSVPVAFAYVRAN